MHTLWFIRMTNTMHTNDIKFCLTATDEAAAREAALARIADAYRAEYHVERIEAICQTPDTVEDFEPV